MNICCTKKLQEELAIKPSAPEAIDPLFSWHANLLRINRKKAVVLVNDASRYNIVLYGLKAKDFGRFSELIPRAIRETLLSEGVNPEIIEDYFSAADTLSFTKTNGAKPVGWLNKGCEAAGFYPENYTDNAITQTEVAKKLNRHIIMNLAGKLPRLPHELFYELLETQFKKPAICCKALQIKVTLLMEHFTVWREVIVPLHFTYAGLHNSIQKLFCWDDYHMHDFTILDRATPVAKIVTELDDFDDERDIPVLLEQETTLENYLPKYKRALYLYDFGDSWEHLIEVQDILFDYDKHYAYCLAGEGDAPPEDIGGEGGYENFVKIMKDPNHAEYVEMRDWASAQWRHPSFDQERVNRLLKYSF